MKTVLRSLLGAAVLALAAAVSAQFGPTRFVGYGTYAGTNGGFNFLTDTDIVISGPHLFDETVTAPISGAESAWTRRQGSITSSQVWLKATTGTTSRSSCSAAIWYEFTFTGSRVKLDYVLQYSPLVWWDDVIVQLIDKTAQVSLIYKHTASESGSMEVDVTPGHKLELYVGLNQNNLNGFSYPAGNTAFRAEATLTPVFVPATLDVNSASPGSGVPITVYTVDHNGFKNGVTPFVRTYEKGQTVSIGAPNTLDNGAKAFDRWEKDGVSQGAARTLTVAMDAGHITTAVYVDAYTLTVNSTNPGTGVPITVYKADVNGLKNGTTFFNRIYKAGTLVALQAPAVVGANGFVRWERDGVSLGTSKTVSVTMGAAHTMNAIYAPLRVLTINSQDPASGVAVSVWTADFYGAKNGSTSFTRTYHDGRAVSLTAPFMAGGNYFRQWLLDGTAYSNSKTVGVTMSAARTLTAVYVPGQTLTVQSVGAAGVTVTVYQRDLNGAQNGTTNFTRLYWQSTVVSLTAPALAAGKTFVRWEVDGIPQGAAKTVSVNMATNHTLVAVYQ